MGNIKLTPPISGKAYQNSYINNPPELLLMSNFFLDCVACHSSKVRKIDLECYQIFTCLNCRLQWAQGDLQNTLPPNIFAPISSYYISKESIGDPNSYEPYQSFFTYIENLYPNRSIRILDIGCGSGCFLEYALYRGHDCIGIEKNPGKALSENIRQRIKITSIDNIQTDELQSFDVITFWDCFEHLQSPFQILDKIKPILNTNGTVFLRVNNRWDVFNLATDFLASISLKWHKKFLINCFGSETWSPHYWNFSKQAMFNILGRKGWTFIHHRFTETPARRLTKNKLLILFFNCAYVFNRMIRGGKIGEYYVRKT